MCLSFGIIFVRMLCSKFEECHSCLWVSAIGLECSSKAITSACVYTIRLRTPYSILTVRCMCMLVVLFVVSPVCLMFIASIRLLCRCHINSCASFSNLLAMLEAISLQRRFYRDWHAHEPCNRSGAMQDFNASKKKKRRYFNPLNG